MSAPRRMSSGSRLALAIAGTVVLVFVSAIGAMAAVVYTAGAVSVEVASADGQDLALRVPASLITLALALVPDKAYAEAAREVRPYMPALREACRQLSDAPDAVFVDVQSGANERVIVAKQGGEILINVRDGDCDVAVSIPVGAVSTVVDRLDSHLR